MKLSTRELNREAVRRYTERNRERINARRRELRALDRGVQSLHNSTYYARHADELRAAKRAYAKANPERVREAARRRRARVAGGIVERYTEAQVLTLYGTDCWVCLQPIDMEAPRSTRYSGWESGLQIDHVELIAVGGSDTLGNVRPAHGICNTRRGKRLS